MNNSPLIIQGGMGAGVSNWRLARAVSEQGQLGVVSGIALAHNSSYFGPEILSAAGVESTCRFSSASRNLRFRSRRRMFCFRTRLNRDLSPFLLDMIPSTYRLSVPHLRALPNAISLSV